MNNVATATPLLVLEQVTKHYANGNLAVAALSDATLAVAAGELVAVMGRSGSGKSTLLTLIGGLEEPTSGTVAIDGKSLAAMSAKEIAELRRCTIGYVFQELNLIGSLTAVENVSLPLELNGMRRKPARQNAITQLQKVGLEKKADQFPDDLSGGEQQRVAIARAMVGDRRVILADEPTGALDSLTGEKVMRLLRAHADAGGAAVLVTHDAQHAAWADRVVYIADGKIVDQAGPLPGPESLLSVSGT